MRDAISGMIAHQRLMQKVQLMKIMDGGKVIPFEHARLGIKEYRVMTIIIGLYDHIVHFGGELYGTSP